MNYLPRPGVCLILLVAAAACAPAEPDASARFEGEWTWAYSRGLYFDSVVRAPAEQRTLLTLARGDFRLVENRGITTEGSYEITDAQFESASETLGPVLLLSETPPFLGDASFVLNLRGDTLFLLTTIDDFVDYAFVR